MSCFRMLSLSVSLAFVAAPALAADWLGGVNQIRSTACGAGKGVAKVSRSPVLDQAARHLSAGTTVESALREAGYAAVDSYAIAIAGAGVTPDVLGTLDEDGCRPLAAAGLAHMGAFQDTRGVWLVLARPLKEPKGDEAEATLSDVLKVTNKARAGARTCGDRQFGAAPPLRLNTVLSESARDHAVDMAEKNYFDHVSPDGSRPLDRVRRAGYGGTPIGENIAAGVDKASEVVGNWLKSPTHCANLMNPAFREIGVGMGTSARSEFGIYWTVVLGAPEEAGPGRKPRQQHARLKLDD